jgi:hypothetical protein
MLANLRVIQAKVEVTYNTDPVPTATDSILVQNFSASFEGARMYERPVIKATLGALPQIYGGSLMSVSFEVELKGSGTAGTAPEIDALLRAAGFAVTNVPATSDTYDPASSGIESCTIYFFEDGTRYNLTGCRGSVTGNLVTGQPGILAFNFTGHFSGPTDVALPSPTYDSTVGPAVLGLSSFAIDSYAASVANVSFDLGNEVAMPDDLTAADGFGEIQITSRKLSGSLDPLNTVIATYDWVAKWKAEAVGSLTTGVVGGTAGNRWQLTIGQAQYTELSWGDRAGLITREVSFSGTESAGDDEISIVFT